MEGDTDDRRAQCSRIRFFLGSSHVESMWGHLAAEKIQRIIPVPKTLWGRCLGLLLRRGGLMYGVCVIYYPPRETTRAARLVYERTLVQLNIWLSEAVAFFRERGAIPLIFTDLNGGLPHSQQDE
eukprot:7471779-Pyramimonas_sp.AAC.1